MNMRACERVSVCTVVLKPVCITVGSFAFLLLELCVL